MFSTGHDELVRKIGLKNLGFLYIAIYLCLLYLYRHPALLFIGAGLLFIELFPQKKWQILFSVNLLALTIGRLAVKNKIHFQEDFTNTFRILSHEKSVSTGTEMSYIIAALFLFAVLIIVLFKFQRDRNKQISHMVTLLLTFLCWYLLAFKQLLGGIGLVFAILILNSVFFLSYEFANFEKRGLRTFFERMTFALPFWQLSAFPIMPVLMGSQYANRIELHDREKILSTKHKAIKQALILLVLNLVINKIFQLLESKQIIFNIADLRLNEMLKYQNTQTLWLSYGMQYMHFLFSEIICSAGMIITMLWMLGYDVPNNTDHPHKALSVSDLMRRLYFYYNQMILSFFIMPTYSLLKNIVENRKIRWFISVFWGVFAGGIIYGILRSLIRIDPMKTAYWPGLLGRSMYFGLLGLALAISTLKLYTIKEEDHWLKKSSATIFVLFLYFIMFLSETKQYSPSWIPKFLLFKKLFSF